MSENKMREDLPPLPPVEVGGFDNHPFLYTQEQMMDFNLRAVQAALAQRGAQEPVAWIQHDEGSVSYALHQDAARRLPDGLRFELYTSPPPAQVPSLPPQSPCSMTEAEMRIFKLGWLECEAAHRALLAKQEGK